MKFHEDISREDLLELYLKQERRLKKIIAKNDAQNKELLELNSELERLATRDPMTNVYNRRYFLEAAEKIIKTSIREKQELCAIILDIDHFKKVNDNYGHDVGDKVIISCANTVSSIVRESDIFARFGGEEFVVLFPNTNVDGAKVIAEKIRLTIEATPVESINITVSIGLARFNAKEIENIDQLIKQADLGLYEAKEGGRNRVIFKR